MTVRHGGMVMLSEYFNLTHFPFTEEGDLRGLFESPAFEETYDELLLGILDGRRMQLLVGPSGAGRTCMLTRIRGGLQATDLHVVTISRPSSSLEELVAQLNVELADLPSPDDAAQAASGEPVGERSAREELATRLEALRDAGRPVVVLIDDAEALGSAILNHVPALLSSAPGPASGWPAGPGGEPVPLAQAVLAVEPDFVQRLTGIELDSLNAAIDGVLQLAAWDRTTVTDYVCAAIEAASGLPGEVFTEDALEAIFVRSEGIPGRVNELCTRAMAEARAQGKRRVAAEHVARALPASGVTGAEPETADDELVTSAPMFTLEPPADARSHGRGARRHRLPARERLTGAADALAARLRRWRPPAAPSQRRVLAGLGLGAVAVVAIGAIALLLRPSGPGVVGAPGAGAQTRAGTGPRAAPGRLEELAERMDSVSRQLVSVEARLRSFETELLGVKQSVRELRDGPRTVLASAIDPPSPAHVATSARSSSPVATAAPPTARAEAPPRAAAEPPPAPAPVPAKKAITPMASGKSGVYTVQRGDTLWGIAKREGTTIASLATLNHLPKDAALRAGQTLYLREPQAPRWYTVQKGDSLYSIGQRFAVTPARLADWNCLGQDARIFPGQRINVQEPTAERCATNRG